MAADPVRFSPWPLTVDFRIPNDGTPTLVCRGRITNETSELFKSEVKKLIPNSKLIVVDLSKVVFVDSSGLGAILATYVSAKCAGCDLKLINLSQRVKELLRITHLVSFFGL
jgi:anti-sigma B factor antagonist